MPDENLESVEAALAVPGKGLGGQAPTPAPVQTVQAGAQTPAVTAPQSPAMKAAMTRVRATLAGLNSGTVRPGVQRNGGFGGPTLTEMFRQMQTPQPAPGTAPAPVPQAGTPATPTAQPGAAAAPTAPTQFTVAKSAFGTAMTSGYDYGGMRVEMPENFNMEDQAAVQAQMDFSNQMADWMNEDEEV